MKKYWLMIFAVLTVFVLLVSACTPAATETVVAPEETGTTPEDTSVSPEPTAESVATEPTVGGTIVIGGTDDADTLDPHKTTYASGIIKFLYSNLLTIDEQGNYVPYIAKSWEISPDGLTYTFHLRDDVKFHNGNPLTAQDAAWSYQRVMDPATASIWQGNFASVDKIEALDDYTLQFTLKYPNYYLLDTLGNNYYVGIVDPKAVEELGDDFGRNPVGTGPFMFKEWVTGDHITLVRNPDFTWGPEYTGGKPPYVESLVFRVVPEIATVLAGMEAGEIDISGGFSPTDDENLRATGMYDFVPRTIQGDVPHVVLNLEKAPFDDLRVRQALNYATDKEAIMNIVAPNSGAVIQNGPLSNTQEGYYPGIEQMGYPFDLEKAKQLMQEAGFTYNADGMLEKDGQPLSFELIISNGGWDPFWKPGAIIQSQWKELGIDVQLVQMELGLLLDTVSKGEFSASLMGYGMPTSDSLIAMFHSKNIGGTNKSRLNDPTMDELLDQMVSAVDPNVHLEKAKEVQIMSVEQAYLVNMFSLVSNDVVSKRIQGYTYDPFIGLRLETAYIVNP